MKRRSINGHWRIYRAYDDADRAGTDTFSSNKHTLRGMMKEFEQPSEIEAIDVPKTRRGVIAALNHYPKR